MEYDSEDDDTIEAFYDRHFPNDIPEEWPLQKQHLTHGSGSLEPGEMKPSLTRLLQILYTEFLPKKIEAFYANTKVKDNAYSLFDVFWDEGKEGNEDKK